MNARYTWLACMTAASIVLTSCAAPAAKPVAVAPQESKSEQNRSAPQPQPQPQPVPRGTRATSATQVPSAQQAPSEERASAPTAAPKAIAEQPAEIGGRKVAVEPTPEGAEPASTPADMTFEDYGVNPFVDTSRDHLSTFALDVDTASYALARSYVLDGNLPPYDAIRVEEFVNYFKQDYALPRDTAFAVYADGAPSPFHSDGSYLLRVGIQGYEVPDAERKPAALTFIIDVSGSMGEGGRLEMVKRALSMLVERLRSDDTVGIVAFTSRAWVALNPTSGRNKNAILNAIDSLSPQNTTNADAGLRLGYQLAEEAYKRGEINRVILCSDGVANTGDVDPDALVEFVRGYSDRISITTVGVGMGNYNDVLLEKLADKGNGFYAYVDTDQEAQKLFLERLTSTLQVIAKDAKVQVDFNPDVVSRYRLIGYENRAIADQDFRNDTVDAGEVGAGHTATALYQVQLKPNGEGRLATVQLRWKNPDNDQVKEINGNFNTQDLAGRFEDTAPRYQLAITVGEYAEILRRSPYVGEMTLRNLRSYADRVAGALRGDTDVQEFADLVSRAANLR